MRLYLIRHGETEDADLNLYRGHTDVPLSERGVRQIEQVSDYILRDSEGLDAVYTSDLIRAIRSAEIISRPHSISPIIEPLLRERGFGIWEGLSLEEIAGRYPEEFEAWASDPLRFSPPYGESTIEVRDRVIRALDRILSEHTEGTIAIVAHGGVNRVILCHLLGIPLENIFRIEQDFAGVNVIEFSGRYPLVRLMNGVFYG